MENEKKETNIIIKLLKGILNIACWIISLFIFLVAIIQFSINYTKIGIVFILAGIVINPKLVKLINNKLNNKLNIKNRIIIMIVLFIAFIISLMSDVPDTLNIEEASSNIKNENVVIENIVEEASNIIEEHKCDMKLVNTIEPTCTTEGKLLYECSDKNCDKKEEDILEPLGHTFNKGICTICSTKDSTYVEEPILSDKEKYIQSCNEYTYKEIARNPHEYLNKNVKFTGEVMQVTETKGWFSDVTTVTVLLSVTKNEYDFYEDNVYCTYTYSKNESKILEDDIITIYGVCEGDYSYTSVLGSSITVPKVTIKYLDIHE